MSEGFTEVLSANLLLRKLSDLEGAIGDVNSRLDETRKALAATQQELGRVKASIGDQEKSEKSSKK